MTQEQYQLAKTINNTILCVEEQKPEVRKCIQKNSQFIIESSIGSPAEYEFQLNLLSNSFINAADKKIAELQKELSEL